MSEVSTTLLGGGTVTASFFLLSIVYFGYREAVSGKAPKHWQLRRVPYDIGRVLFAGFVVLLVVVGVVYHLSIF